MSLAENLLNSMSTTTYGSTEATEAAEPHIVIDNSRQMIVPNSLKTIAVTGDKDIETVTFDCIRYWDGHDLSTFALYINYELPNGSTGTYIPQNLKVGDEYISFTWTIGSPITSVSGRLTFSIEAVQTGDNYVVLYRWSTIPNGDMTIVKGLSRGEIPDEEITEDVVSQVLEYANMAADYAQAAKEVVVDAANVVRDELAPELDLAKELEWALEALDELIGGRP
jgi:hypothetical protein